MARRLALTLFLAGGVTLLLAASDAQRGGPTGGPRPRYVFTEREAFLLMTPELVSPPAVSAVDWSPDSRFVLAEREYVPLLPAAGTPPVGERSLVVWSRSKCRAVEVWKAPLEATRIKSRHWLAGADVAFVLVAPHGPPLPGMEWPRATLLRVDAARSTCRVAGELDPPAEIVVSPSRPLAIVRRPAEGATELQLLRSDGTVRPVGRIPASVPVRQLHWSPDGRRIWVESYKRPPGVRGPAVDRWHSVEIGTGRLAPLAARPDIPEPRQADYPLRLKSVPVSVREGDTTASVRPLWLESPVPSEMPRALVVADADRAHFSPDGAAVLYVSEGAAWAVPLERRPKAEVLAAIREAQKAVTISNAKQLGLALIMYSQDYDDRLPPSGDSVKNALLPYLKNESLFQNPATGGDEFVFSYDGGPLNSLSDPSRTLMGFLNGPGGRAVIYADGHVMWEMNGG